ncbi:MAG: pilin [Magnetococcales bacterium]|nr:pilin [Magnetococcales bacterium]
MKSKLRSQLEAGFTLIELMIVIAIIGILAAVGIPAYQDYIARSQMSEAINLLGGSKTGLVEYYTTKGVWPSALTDVYNTASGKYVGSITGANSSGTYVVSATMATSGVNSAITAAVVKIQTGNGGTSWNCGPSNTTAHSKYLPSSCRDTMS